MNFNGSKFGRHAGIHHLCAIYREEYTYKEIV